MFTRLFCWAYFWGSLFSEVLVIGRNFAFQNGFGLSIKTSSSNSPWAYIQEGLSSEGYLRLRFGGLIFGRAYFFFFGGGGGGGGLLSEFYGITNILYFLFHHQSEKRPAKRAKKVGMPLHSEEESTSTDQGSPIRV